MVAKTDFCARAHANGFPREKPYVSKTKVMQNQTPSPTDGPKDLDQKVRYSLGRLLAGISDKSDPLLQAVKKSKTLVEEALSRDATIADILQHFNADGVSCKRDRLQNILVKLGLWPRRKGENPRAAATTTQ